MFYNVKVTAMKRNSVVHKPTTYLKKQVDYYLQRHELDRDFADVFLDKIWVFM